MRRCGQCKLVPRRDDPLAIVQFQEQQDGSFLASPGTVTLSACRACVAQLNGTTAVDPTYPHGREYQFLVCGICRLAMRDNDIGTIMRIAEQDVAGLEVEAGCYSACLECVERFKPRIHRRLTEHPEQYDPQGQGARLPELAHFGGNWLV